MLIDYHLHTCRCGHATGSMADYLKAARNKGLVEVGFADHLPLYFLPPEKRDPGLAMPLGDLREYVTEVLALQQNNFDLKIKLGIEADYIQGMETYLPLLLYRLPLDFVTGSIHFLDGWGFDNPKEIDKYENLDLDRSWKRYFYLLRKAALSNLFDIIAHPDLIKKFGFKPEGDFHQEYEQTAHVFQKAGVCIEVNPAGLRAPVREIYPAQEFLSYCHYYKVPVTLGSDAHSPDQVGEGIAEATNLLKKVGYQEIAIFNKRQRKIIPL